MNSQEFLENLSGSEIAVVGLAGCFPGAENIDIFWQNLVNGIEARQSYADQALRKAGVSERLLQNPNYVKSGRPLPGMELFDPAFFGLGPRDAAIMDPQHRHFLQCAWQALEHAGYDPFRFAGLIGVYGGSGHNGYLAYNLLTNPDLVDNVGFFLLRHTGNDKDFLTTRVSYLLDLKGPSVNVQTACSTSLVAIHLAVQSLLSRECDMALAGGVTIELPHGQGYLYHEGEILAPDGHCRAFDADSAGTVFGSGVGVVVLRRLDEAIRTGDTIHAVILGSAINNDGLTKANYLAPSVDGQAAAVEEAIALAGIEADTISYVETHGTGTRLGDPIEIAALTRAFRATTGQVGYCRIGSVKTNIGHLDTAAGVASFIKTTLALKHKQLPASLNFNRPNPMIDFETSPFFVNATLAEWPAKGGPRRAGVNSLGVGGTNAHLILEEAPQLEPSGPSRPWQLLLLSAKTETALAGVRANLAQFLQTQAGLNLADVAYTLQVGRRPMAYRQAVLCRNGAEAVRALTGSQNQNRHQASAGETGPVVFMFPGQGAQYPGMGQALYEQEELYRTVIDDCARLLQPYLQFDLRQVLYPAAADLEAATLRLQQTAITQPALFVTEYALAKLLMAWGVRPAALIGHSLGEYVAACLAGVFSLEAALALVTKRGRLMQQLPGGSMLAVFLAESALQPFIDGDLAIAAVNGPEFCVVSGPDAAINGLIERFTTAEIEYRPLKTSHAFHSGMMAPILAEFQAEVQAETLHSPQIPFLSNVSGNWISDAEATDPRYWAGHIRHPVYFAQGLEQLGQGQDKIRLLEVGPGQTLGTFARQLFHTREPLILATLPHPQAAIPADAFLLQTLGALWVSGQELDWTGFYGQERRYRIPLPTYPFEKQRYWIEAGQPLYRQAATPVEPTFSKIPDQANWFYRPVWQRAELEPQTSPKPGPAAVWLLFVDSLGIGSQLAERLGEAGQQVVCIRPGRQFSQLEAMTYSLDPAAKDDYQLLLQHLTMAGQFPQRVVHLWSLSRRGERRLARPHLQADLELGFFSLLYLAQVLAEAELSAGLQLNVISNDMQPCGDSRPLYPEKATILGPCRVLPREFPGLTCKAIDISGEGLDQAGSAQPAKLVEQLLPELLTGPPENITVAYRGQERWLQTISPIDPTRLVGPEVRLRPGGVYLITGGLGGVGRVIARYLAQLPQVKLVLLSRSGLPAREQWDSYLDSHPATDRTAQQMQSVRDLEGHGAEVMVLAADVADPAQMNQAIDQVRSRFGSLQGVIHAAGVIADGPVQLKSRSEAERVLAPKVAGTLVLDEVLSDYPLDFLILFSSTSALLGLPGQVDYAAANAFLDAYSHSQAAQARVTVSLNWGMWQNVGMTALPSAPAPAGAAMDHPLLGVCLSDTPEKICYQTELRPEVHWVIDQHRLKGGDPLLPGSAYLEMARAALTKGEPKGGVEITDLYFLRPLSIKAKESRAVQITLEKNERGYYFQVNPPAASTPPTDLDPNPYAQGKVAYLNGDTGRAQLNLDDIKDRCPLRNVSEAITFVGTNQEQYLDFGPRWRWPKQVGFAEGEALARLDLPPAFRDDLNQFVLHPALLDVATGYALPLIKTDQAGRFFVPFSYRRICLYPDRIPPVIYSYIRYRGASGPGDLFEFDITISDERGRSLIDIESFTMKAVAASTFKVTEPEATPTAASPPISAWLELARSQGISPAEGGQLFAQIVNGNFAPQVIVSSLDFAALLQKAEADRLTTATAEPGDKLSRPQLPNQYAGPANEIEQQLVTLWGQLLGVEQIGIYDNFFELGGHSLIAVRLLTRLKKLYAVDLPLSTLFEAPTIAALAKLLQPEGKTTDPVSARPERGLSKFGAWNPLVAIQPQGTKPPLFCVHGQHGNVMNFAPLSRYLGPDQPFYGFQSRGVDGKLPAITDFKEMAGIYNECLRQVQPEGPYLLSGFSMGGEIAMEMAFQLQGQGQQVKLLILFDTYEPDYARLNARQLLKLPLEEPGPANPAGSESEPGGSRWARFRLPFHKLNKTSLLGWADARQKRLKYTAGKLYVAAGLKMPQEINTSYLEIAHTLAILDYELNPYRGDVLLLRSEAIAATSGNNPALRWEKLVSNLQVHHFACRHDNMLFEPTIFEAAKTLQKYL